MSSSSKSLPLDDYNGWADFERHIDIICRKYGISYLNNGNGNDKLSLIPIKDLFKSDIKICGGHNRHEALLCIMVSLLIHYRSILSSDAIRNLIFESISGL